MNKPMVKKITLVEMEKAFTEWDQRYRNDPENFMSTEQHLLKETPYSYGKLAGLYFFNLLKELKNE